MNFPSTYIYRERERERERGERDKLELYTCPVIDGESSGAVSESFQG